MTCPDCGADTAFVDGIRECTVCDWPMSLAPSILDASGIEDTDDDPAAWLDEQTEA